MLGGRFGGGVAVLATGAAIVAAITGFVARLAIICRNGANACPYSADFASQVGAALHRGVRRVVVT